jgi:small-conductance mechanosensitive channel
MLDEFDASARRIIIWFDWAPGWLVSLVVLAVALLVAEAVYRAVFRLLTRLVRDRSLFWRSLVASGGGPVRLAMMIFAISIATGVAPLTPGQSAAIRQALLVCFICLLGWVALSALTIWTSAYLRRFKLDAEDNLLARKHVTQSNILQRVAATLIFVVTLAAALMTFPDVRQYGVSLLASAGAAGLVVGLALQPLLKNLVAGIQLAITQPIRIEDAVIVEGEWGNVEEITATYVVVRIWDWRRMVLPLSYFIEHPFQNWTRHDAALIGTVMMYVDYRAPIAEMRRKLEETAGASPLWDGKVVNMAVTDLREQTMEVRILVSGTNAGRTFDLRCEMREKLMAWLQTEHPYALPHHRTDIDRLPRDMALTEPARPTVAAK